ncbi:MAG: cob(I)yrinic acid a,c-diamide adenosyltransferase [Anaerolineae bacterium]|nr:cob(I)yrinic acid a,c-diamide adenosyltransferase [Anaerolineae bacterium]
MKIYTRTGDDGTTALFSGGRVPKYHPRVEAYGTVDEMNSVLGVARALKPSPDTEAYLTHVQSQLFHLGADLATMLDSNNARAIRITETQVRWLEESIDALTAQLPPLAAFILPGGTPAAAQIHIARTICRRVERLVAQLAGQEAVNANLLPYLNRLSDFLFTLARWENHHAGIADEQWTVSP